MTRGQVRAAMRRLREHHEEAEEETGEINLVPYMDIVTNIIIFLLASVITQVPLGNVNVTSPAIQMGGAPSQDEKPKEDLNLTITVGANGLTIAASGAVLMGPNGQPPTLPKVAGEYDFKALTKRLTELKADPANDAADETKANFNADATIPYATVIETLDAMRTDAEGKMLFPDINFAAGMQ